MRYIDIAPTLVDMTATEPAGFGRYPTIVEGIAALELTPEADGTPPLDGISAWPAITGASIAGQRTEVLLNL